MSAFFNERSESGLERQRMVVSHLVAEKEKGLQRVVGGGGFIFIILL